MLLFRFCGSSSDESEFSLAVAFSFNSSKSLKLLVSFASFAIMSRLVGGFSLAFFACEFGSGVSYTSFAYMYRPERFSPLAFFACGFRSVVDICLTTLPFFSNGVAAGVNGVFAGVLFSPFLLSLVLINLVGLS